MTSDPRISLVIPTHDRAHLIVQTIESALRQSQPFHEIIVVDDASTDDTLARLQEFDDRIRVIGCAKIGVQAARNIGVDAAQGDYVTLCDSDDLLQFRFVETMGKWLATHPQYDSVYSNYQSFSGKTLAADILSGAPSGFFEGAVFDGEFITHVPDLYGRTIFFQPLMPTGATFRKRFYQSIGGFNPAFDGVPSEDWEYTLRAIEAGRTAICVKPLVHIRHHAGNDSKNRLRQALGEVEVLKFALLQHPLAARYRDRILQGIRQRKHMVFYESFRTRQFNVASLAFPGLDNIHGSLRFKFKAMVMAFYMKWFKPDPQYLYRRN